MDKALDFLNKQKEKSENSLKEWSPRIELAINKFQLAKEEKSNCEQHVNRFKREIEEC